MDQGNVSEKVFYTYICLDSNGNKGLRFELVPRDKTTVRSLDASTEKKTQSHWCKSVQWLTHAPASEMKILLNGSQLLDRKTGKACDKVEESFEICAQKRRPVSSRKCQWVLSTSIESMYSAWIFVVYLREQKYFVLKIIWTDTNYGERITLKTEL